MGSNSKKEKTQKNFEMYIILNICNDTITIENTDLDYSTWIHIERNGYYWIVNSSTGKQTV